jgi:hypothetical protein
MQLQSYLIALWSGSALGNREFTLIQFVSSLGSQQTCWLSPTGPLRALLVICGNKSFTAVD